SAMTSRSTSIVAALRREGRWLATLSGVRPVLNLPDTTLLQSDDGRFGFIDAINPSIVSRRFGPVTVQLAGASVRVAGFTIAARGVSLVPIGVRAARTSASDAVAAGLATPPPFSSTGTRTMASAGVRVAFAPDAGARIAELSFDGAENSASGIGLLRDNFRNDSPPSARDYIGAYTHPLPAGTFNRRYTCSEPSEPAVVTCTYDSKGSDFDATFERTMRIDETTHELIVDERYQRGNIYATSSRLGPQLESISGFAMRPGDVLIAPSGVSGAGVLHAGRLTAIRWRPDEVGSVMVRATRGAALVTLDFRAQPYFLAPRPVELRFASYQVASVAEAERILQANPR
ncbi:MAG TPA: hypothetical protein VGK84_00730, partial [Candidatus Tumulicola sp.]